MSGALADGVGRVGAVLALLAGGRVGRGSCCALLWTVLAWLDHMDHNGAHRSDEIWPRRALVLTCSVDVLDQKVGNKIDLILA